MITTSGMPTARLPVGPGRLCAREPILTRGFKGLVQGGEDPPFSDDLDEAALSQIRKKIGADARQEEMDFQVRKISDKTANGLSRGKVDICYRFGANNEPFDGAGALSTSWRTSSAKRSALA